MLGTVAEVEVDARKVLFVTVEVVDADMHTVEYVLNTNHKEDLSYLAAAGTYPTVVVAVAAFLNVPATRVCGAPVSAAAAFRVLRDGGRDACSISSSVVVEGDGSYGRRRTGLGVGQKRSVSMSGLSSPSHRPWPRLCVLPQAPTLHQRRSRRQSRRRRYQRRPLSPRCRPRRRRCTR